MDDIEQRLRRLPLAAPSPGLDQRIEAAFAAARREPRRSRRPLFWWALGLSAAGAGVFLVMVARLPGEAPAPQVHVVEAEGHLRAMLVDPTDHAGALPEFVIIPTAH